MLKNPRTFRPLNSFFHPLASQFFDLDSAEVHLSGPGYALGQADSWLHGCTVAHIYCNVIALSSKMFGPLIEHR